MNLLQKSRMSLIHSIFSWFQTHLLYSNSSKILANVIYYFVPILSPVVNLVHNLCMCFLCNYSGTEENLSHISPRTHTKNLLVLCILAVTIKYTKLGSFYIVCSNRHMLTIVIIDYKLVTQGTCFIALTTHLI